MKPPSATLGDAVRLTVLVSTVSVIVVVAAAGSTTRLSKLPPDALAIVVDTLAASRYTSSPGAATPTEPVLVPAIALIAISCVAKTATGWIASAGLDVEARLRAGTALIAHGEFSIVIAGLAVSGNFDPDLAALAATLVLGTALLGPLATHFADDLARLLPQGRATTAVQQR